MVSGSRLFRLWQGRLRCQANGRPKFRILEPQDFGFRVQGVGFRVEGLGLRAPNHPEP